MIDRVDLKVVVLWAAVVVMTLPAMAGDDYTGRVNVFLGSASSAQCSPAAIRPFGMISPGPFNRPGAPCGYNNRTRELIGFNHTHLQGTGCGSYGVLILLPTTGDKALGTKVDVPAGRQSGEPGYYRAEIDAMGISAEMTCTKRAAIHRYTFPKTDSARVLIDLSQGAQYCGKADVTGSLSPVGKTGLKGHVNTTAWGEHTTWFHLEFSKPVNLTNLGEKGGYVSFDTADGEALLVKVGISYVSAENANLNVMAECPDWDFDAVRRDANREWNARLATFDVKGGTRDQQVNFYTAVYHSMFHPQLTSDVNNQYRGLDGKVHTTAGHNHYSVLSTWDTFRAAHPLYTLIAPDLQLDVIKTMLDDYRDCGWGPRWKLGPKEVFCMPGSWCDVIIPDAYIKGITDFDTETAWELVYKNATIAGDGDRGRRDNLEDYLELGYVSYPHYINVTKTLEHAYCDFSIARFAEVLGKEEDAAEFFAKAKNYHRLWDPETRFFRGKDRNGDWSYPDSFDPFTYTGKGNNDYCEGNAWQWTWHVMQDTQGLIDLMGGDAAFEARLDEFMTAQGGRHGSEEFGQYWHGNEPDQHALYAYNYCGKPAKGAEKIRLCLEREYRNDTWGISGNEDAGQMSAWYIFSAMGFYPYVHSVPEYTIGSPIFDEVTLTLPSGKKCVIRAKGNSAENMYVQSMTIHGEPWDKTWLSHDAIVDGGTIEFVMGPQPSNWGTAEESRPYSMTPRAKEPKPNIVIVLADDVGFSDFGCYGSEIDTPNIDRLASNGIRFSQFCSENKCNPSRTSLMTGQYYIRGYSAGHTITIPEGLKDAGYRSYISGKWDVVADASGGPLARSFDHFYGFTRGCGSQFAPLGLQRDGKNAEHEWQEDKDFYYTHAITDNALRYIEQTPEDDPFFLLVSYTAPHWPMHALPEDIRKYEGRYAEGWDVLRRKRLERMKTMGLVPPDVPLPPRDRQCTAWNDAPHKAWQQRRMEVYAAMIDSMDQGVGKIVQRLKDLGRFENTLILVLADNGASAENFASDRGGRFLNATTRGGSPMRVGCLPAIMPGPEDTWQTYGPDWALLSSTPFRLYKGTEHQGGHAVPLIAHWPQMISRGGRISDDLCHVIDLLPTVLDAADVTYPAVFEERDIVPADGKSLAPIFEGTHRDGHDALYWGSVNGKAVREGRWKLVRLGREPWELYDMESDRTELNNLADRYPEKVRVLECAWEAWRDSDTLPQAWRSPYIFPVRN